MFLWKNMDNYPKTIPVTPSYLEHRYFIWFRTEEAYKNILRPFYLCVFKEHIVFLILVYATIQISHYFIKEILQSS